MQQATNVLYCVFRMFRRRPTCLLRNTVFPETREELCLVMKEQGLGQIIFQFSVVIFVCSMFRSRFMMFNTSIKSTADRNYTFATNSNFLISISFQPDGINICNFKTCLQYWFANWKRDLKTRVCGKNSITLSMMLETGLRPQRALKISCHITSL